MSNYIVSARKYRPDSFDSVVGQHTLTTTLKNAIAAGKLAHAYLFCGPRGVGKTTCARIFAKTINCLSPTPGGDACNTCESCTAFNEQRSYNIHELDAASNNSVEDIRQLIDQVRIPPQVGRYKVFIIDEVHMLSTAAFNAFLKTLEEPPAHAIFVLATTEKHKILPTILSRCQTYDFARMEVEDIVDHLRHVAAGEGYTYEDAALNVIARKADGGMRDALSIFDQAASFTGGNITYQKVIENLNVLDYDYYFQLTDLLLRRDIPASLLLLNEILSKGFEGNHFIGGLAAHFRDLLVSRDAATLPLLEVADSVRQRYSEQAARCTPQFIYAALKLCNRCDQDYRTSRNKRLSVELTLIEVAQLLEPDEPSSGRSPKKILKPLFQATGATVAPVATREASATRSENTPTQKAIANTAAGTPIVAADTAAAHRPTHTRTTRHSISIHGARTQADTAETPKEQAPKETFGTQPYDAGQLLYAWNLFAGALSKEETALTNRMRATKPTILQDDVVEVVMDSPQALSFIQERHAGIEQHLRRTLNNGNIKLQFRVREQTEAPRYLSRRELYQKMLQKSAALRSLKEALRLELS